jgi:hypothetical protein
MSNNDLATYKQEVFDYVRAFLGDGMVDVELDPLHYETALKKALSKYRQRSDNSVEESYIFLQLVEDQNVYILPKEVIAVRQIYRRSVGSRSGGGAGGSNFEPFNLAYTNTYLLSGSKVGGLATYELFAGYQEQVAKMFGAYIQFTWDQPNHKLTIFQRPRASEEVMLYAYNHRPDSTLLNDYLASQWIKDYTLANCKYMLGEARSKFATINGPGGGTSLNGDALKSEAQLEIEKLEKDVSEQVAGGAGFSFIIG